MALDAIAREGLKERALRVRRGIVEGTHTCGGSLSQTDILVALCFKCLKYDPRNPLWEERDRFVLSKGHGGVGYAVVPSTQQRDHW